MSGRPEPIGSAEPTAITEVAPDLWRVPLVTPTLPPATRTNSFVWKSAAGWLVIDPGSPKRGEIERLRLLLHEKLGPDELLAYVVTHHHPDHWGGLDRCLGAVPAPVVVRDPSRYGRLAADIRAPEWLNARLGEAALIDTPGHASDHLVVRTEAGDVLAGDLVAGVGTVVINPPDGDMTVYLDSLERLLGMGVRRLFAAHGPTIEDGAAKLREYLDHRAQRERQVIEALRAAGPATPGKLVPRIYPDLGLLLRPVAARSMLAHLLKLEREGRAESVGRTWRLLDRDRKE